jgi:hypothetical protein
VKATDRYMALGGTRVIEDDDLDGVFSYPSSSSSPSSSARDRLYWAVRESAADTVATLGSG